jgi:hypothetical protein
MTSGFIFPLLSTPDVSSTGLTQQSASKGTLLMLKVAVQGAPLLFPLAHLLTIYQETRSGIPQEETCSCYSMQIHEEPHLQNPAQTSQESRLGPTPKTEAQCSAALLRHFFRRGGLQGAECGTQR